METTQIVDIKLVHGMSAIPDIYELDNLTTEIRIDFTSMGVDHWTKYVDMEMSDGTTTRLDLGNDIVVSFPLSNSVTVTGVLKINPLAVLQIETEQGEKRVAQKGFKTFLFNVQGTVNTYGYGSWGRDDILIPIAENLNEINEFLDLKYLDPLDDLNLKIESGLYGYMGFNEIKNSPVLGMSILVYNVKMKDNAESVIQMLWDVHPDSPNFNKLFTRRCIPATSDWSTWSNPDAEVQKLRDWTAHMIEEVVGLDEQAIQDLLNLQNELIQLRESFLIVNQNVVDMGVEIESIKTDVLNELALQTGLINDLSASLAQTNINIQQLTQSLSTTNSNLADAITVLQAEIDANVTTLNSRITATSTSLTNHIDTSVADLTLSLNQAVADIDGSLTSINDEITGIQSIINAPGPSSIVIGLSANVAITTTAGNSAQSLAFNTLKHNYDPNSSFSWSGGRLTCNKAGIVKVRFNLTFYTTATVGYVVPGIRRNTVELARTVMQTWANSYGNGYVELITQVDAGQYFEFYIGPQNAGTVQAYQSTTASIEYMNYL